jgi:hypothetical protein
MSPIQYLRTSLAYVVILSLFITGLLTLTPDQSYASNNSLRRSLTPTLKEPSEKGASETRAVDEATRARVSEAYSRLPLSFEENRGQVDKEVKFLSRGAGYTLFLTPTEAVLALRQSDGKETMTNDAATPSSIPTKSHPTLMSALRMKLSGANQSPAVRGESEMGVKINYFKGNDPQKWQAGVARYERVRYAQVYPGVDMVYYGQQQQLEYDFEVAPGADARRIALEFTGVRRVQIERETGDLLLQTGGGEVRQHKPVSYQEEGGERREVASRYVVKGKRKVGIEVGKYDLTKRLVIDPVLSYSTYLGGSSIDVSNSIAVDASGHAYVTGYTDSTDFPTLNQYQADPTGTDVFVTKLDTNASGVASLLYSTYLGGDLIDRGLGIAVDSSGHAYVMGLTDSTDFPTLNQFQTDPDGSHTDAFVTKLDTNASGTASLLYSTYLGGSFGDVGQAIAADSSGHAYVTGYTESPDFPTLNQYQGDQNVKDGFVTKLDTNASGAASLLYSTYLGGSSDDIGRGIVIDSSGIAYVTGSTNSTNFPVLNQYQTYQGDFDAFVTKLNTNTSGAASLLYSTYLGGGSYDEGLGIGVDASGRAYVTGYTYSYNFPVRNQYQSPHLGADAFVTKLDTNTSGTASLLYSTHLGSGYAEDYGTGIAVATSGIVYVTGYTSASDFPVLHQVQTYQGGVDAFVTKLDTNASGAASLLYSTYLGGSYDDRGTGIAVDAAGHVYVTGHTSSNNFSTHNQYQADQGGTDAFVTKLTEVVNNYSTYLGGNFGEVSHDIVVDSAGIAYVTGGTDSTDFPVLGGPQINQADTDAFVVKLDTNASGAASLLYSAYLGGDRHDNAQRIAIDSSGIAYVAGYTDSTDFPLLNQYQIDQASRDAFVTKLDTNASGAASLLYSTYLGGSSDDVGNGIALDSTGHAYVAGYTDSADFPTLNQYQTYRGADDVFVTKLDTNASGAASLLYSTYLGGNSGDVGYGIAVDASGVVYTTGYTDSTDFPTLNQFQTDQGDRDVFVTKLDTNLSGMASLLYSSYLGGNDYDESRSIAINASGYAYVTGITFSTEFPLLNQYQTYQGGEGDVFVTKLNTNTSGAASLLYSTYLGGNARDFGVDIAVDSSGIVYVTGDTPSTNFPTLDALQSDQGSNDAFVTKINTNASGTASLLYSTYLGGSTYDVGYGIAVDPSGVVYVTGTTYSSDFPIINQYQTDLATDDAFVTKLPNIALISGRVTSDGTNGISGVTVTLSGSMPNTVVTDSNGNYSIKAPTGGNYTVTPSNDPLTFNPPVRSFINLQTNQTDVNFMANPLAISGRVTSDGTNGISGVTVTLSGSQTGTIVTDSTGNYSFTGLFVGGNYTVTPTKSGLVFEPTERSFTNLQASQTNVNFTGGLATISGRVTSDGVNGISGVNVYLSGSQTGTVVTDGTGSYSFTNLAGGGSYTVTPTKSDLIFTPSERTFTNLQSSQTGVDFTTEPATISGRVTTDTGAGLVGVIMTLTNATLSLTTTTANDGTYSFGNLPIPASYKVKPSKTGYTFSPSDIVLYNLSTHQHDVNFIGSASYMPQPSTISGRVTIETPTGAVLAGVTITLTSGPDFTQSTTTASDGTYSFSNLPTRDTYMLTPSRVNYTFTPSQIALNNLKTNQANANFVAKLKTYNISGVVKFGSTGFSDVTVVLTSPNPSGFAPRTATTDSTGAYTLANVPAERDYTVTPTKPGYQFTPVNKSFSNLSGNQAAVNFAVVFYSITGRITRTGTTTGISGVTVTITSPVPANFEARTTQTGPLGNYQFTVLPAGRDYTIEPAKAGFTFTPTTRSITNLSGNIPAGATTNFTGTGP